MNHFILEGRHLKPFETFAHLEPLHHEFLQKGYDTGSFLFSGPQVPPHGGFLVARAESRGQLDALLAEEPFVKGGFMEFSSIKRLDPVQYEPFLKSWFAGTSVASEKTKPIAKHGPAQNKAGNGAKHYLVEWEQTIPLEKSDSLLKAAKCFLANGYLNGRCLFSGPTVPANGSFLVARAGSLKELDNLLAEERYHQASVKRIKQITEFIALQHQPFLNEWFVGDQKQRA